MNQSAERMPSGAMSDEPAGMGDARERRNPLLETALFKQVSEEQARELVPYLHHEEYDKGEYIFTEGDTDQRMYVIQEGRVKLTRQSVDKRVQLLSIHTRGELLGEIPVFDPQGGPRTANAVARWTAPRWCGSTMTHCSRGSANTRAWPSTCCRCSRIACAPITSALPTWCSAMCPAVWRKHC